MATTCSQCSRVNPPEAFFCYFDGASLSGRTGGPVQAGSQPFGNPFVFPSGQQCRNFDQLAMTCQQNWSTAVDLLKQGFLGSFLGGMGRIDLAMAAQEAAKFPDPDRGLDQLLEKLPTRALDSPQLKAEPSEINLGQIEVGTDRATEIHLTNLGMRLLYGSVSSDCKWLSFGEAPGHSEKMFSFGAEQILPVQVRGQHLRAGSKPLEGHLTVDSNGGKFTLTVKAQVPVKPFPEGILAGALSPRQIAEKAKASAAAAAPLFQNGAIQKWFASNGWTYPVSGPSASGLGGIQQFFEALGLAKAPKVEINVTEINLKGDPGQTLTYPIEVTTQEKKVVYGYASSDYPWIDGNKVKLEGRKATINLTLQIPDEPGETIKTNVIVHGNGSQRFTLPLTLAISGTRRPKPAPSESMFEAVEDESPAFEFVGSESAPAPAAAADDFAFTAAATPAVTTAPAPTAAPAVVAVEKSTTPAPEPVHSTTKRSRASWLHYIPLSILFVALLGCLLHDVLGTAPSGPESIGPIDPLQRLFVHFDYEFPNKKGRPGEYSNSMRFGLTAVDPNEPEEKRLTFHKNSSISAMAMVDRKELVFAKPTHGRWDANGMPKERPSKYKTDGAACTWLFQHQIKVHQEVDIVPGELVEVASEDYKRVLDTCRVRYTITNKDNRLHRVRFRVLIDTYIGSNDGVPFLLPGADKLTTRIADFHANDKGIPDFIQAFEYTNLNKPGTIMQMMFKPHSSLEVPERVSLTRYPGTDKIEFYPVPVEGEEKEVPIPLPPKTTPKGKTEPKPEPKKQGEKKPPEKKEPEKKPPEKKPPEKKEPEQPKFKIVTDDSIGRDSAVVIYWEEKAMRPNETRYLGFNYGLGNASGQGNLRILNPGGVAEGQTFSLVALVGEVKPNMTATLKLPEGFTLLKSEATQPVVHGDKGADGLVRPSPITWRIHASRSGTFNFIVSVEVDNDQKFQAVRRIAIAKSLIF